MLCLGNSALFLMQHILYMVNRARYFRMEMLAYRTSLLLRLMSGHNKKGMQCHELHPFYLILKVYSPFFILSSVTWYFALFSAATRSTAFCCMAIAWSFLPSLYSRLA
ncbi:hypothetical protein SRABI36_02199 [Pedobacter sp. Bi36]|nr:hypothetical protein SRABI36_02199 [Pedobacter sp. Bi36]